MLSVPNDERVIARLLESATRNDGHPPFSGHKLEALGGDRSRSGVWAHGSVTCVVGVASFHAASGRWAVEIAVAPECRGPEMEETSIRAATDLVPDSAVHTIWAFRPNQIDAAGRLGYREIRAVLRMTGPIPNRTIGPPSRIAIGMMESMDVGAMVAVNNRAFSGHPEQGAMTEADFESLMGQPWFDPAAVLVAREGERIAGFCITKQDGDQVGEIFVIAVDPVDQHSGIGRDLIGAGFDVLWRRDVTTVNVWVDGANQFAVRFYASLGLAEDFRTRELALP